MNIHYCKETNNLDYWAVKTSVSLTKFLPSHVSCVPPFCPQQDVECDDPSIPMLSWMTQKECFSHLFVICAILHSKHLSNCLSGIPYNYIKQK